MAIPPSLQNIFQEIEDDLGIPAPPHGELTAWAKSGVLLLNNVLTVREGQANSHRGRGWETLTDRVISLVNDKQTPVVFLLWGANAREKARLVTNPRHFVLTCAHPSPLSAFNGFFGCRHFSKTNELLEDVYKRQAQYAALMREHKMPNIITTACPTVVLLEIGRASGRERV